MQMNMNVLHAYSYQCSLTKLKDTKLEQYKNGERDIILFVLWEHLDAHFPTGILKECPAFDSENKGFS